MTGRHWLAALSPAVGVVAITAFNAFHWLPIRGESPRPRRAGV